MSREMWVRSMTFFYIAKAFHGNGLLRAFAIYLFIEKKVPYEVFYDGFINFFEAHPDLLTAKLYFEIKKHAAEQAKGENNRKLTFEPCGDIIWDDHEFLVLHLLEKLELFYEEMLPYLKQYSIPEDIFEDLLAYQKAIMRRPNDSDQTVLLQYDVHQFLSDVYINQAHPLQKKTHRLLMRATPVQQTWRDFGKIVVWFGRMGWSSYKDDLSAV